MGLVALGISSAMALMANPTTLAAAGGHILARTADQGFADFCGVVTLRHGTNPLSWISIHILGFIPACGGNRFGGDVDAGCDEQNNGNIYFIKDTFKDFQYESYFIKVFRLSFVPFVYSSVATANLIVGSIPLLQGTFKTITRCFFTALCIPVGLVLPTIKVRKTPEEVEYYCKDPSMSDCCSTNQWVSPINNGLVGTLWSGLSYKIVTRAMDDPLRCLKGIFYLAVSVFAAQYALATIPAFILAHRTAIIAGAILAIV